MILAESVTNPMTTPKISSIWIATAAGAELHPLDTAEIVAGRGIIGDRYHIGKGSFSRWQDPWRAITFIEQEAIETAQSEHGIIFSKGRARRNVVTIGIPLEDLIGRHFRIGSAEFKGSRICHPCRYLDRVVEAGSYQALKHRGGIRAEIVKSGSITIGDEIFPSQKRSFLP
jgi:hypothetical protein